ncbi:MULTISPECIES: type II toxin-antitoxin system VapB family antitoxin [Henriciella]|jgi:Arc/MetJ family transcription regulator|uniref:Type II toxin-antitoxin system VapB family antitoxin n=1 Tax=Henriciella pelagia TaxID=1977912 RepID=A0ABQ1JSF1_9PROT|nr:type II toxin-antitoxin system VapB family antitoxin [Henriciella pelagia]GGB73520.1 hypothetical protein GCM10011503_22750 [Henriciella pelagia]
MRTNIDIDDKLMEEAIRLGGFSTKKEAVTESLKLLIQLKRQDVIRGLKGKLDWSGDLGAMRAD